MSRMYGYVDVAMHGKVTMLEDVLAMVKEWEGEDWWSDVVRKIEKELNALETNSKDEVVTIVWSDFFEYGVDEILLPCIDDWVKTYPELELAVKAKIANSITDEYEYFRYYSSAGETTIFYEEFPLNEEQYFLEFSDLDNVDWIPAWMNDGHNGDEEWDEEDEEVEESEDTEEDTSEITILLHGELNALKNVFAATKERGEAMGGVLVTMIVNPVMDALEQNMESIEDVSTDGMATITALIGGQESIKLLLMSMDILVVAVPEIEVAMKSNIDGEGNYSDYYYYSPAGIEELLEFNASSPSDVKFPDVDWIPVEWRENR